MKIIYIIVMYVVACLGFTVVGGHYVQASNASATMTEGHSLPIVINTPVVQTDPGKNFEIPLRGLYTSYLRLGPLYRNDRVQVFVHGYYEQSLGLAGMAVASPSNVRCFYTMDDSMYQRLGEDTYHLAGTNTIPSYVTAFKLSTSGEGTSDPQGTLSFTAPFDGYLYVTNMSGGDFGEQRCLDLNLKVKRADAK